MFFILVLVAVAAFLFGFFLGDTREFTDRKTVDSRIYENEILRKEYENFLKYDGTEQ